MKNIRLFFVLGFMFSTGLCLAQEDNVTTDASALQGVLSGLKQNVEKLGFDNDQLSSRDKYVKGQVLQLKMQLRALEAQGDVLNKTVAQLQDENPGRTQQINRLENENAKLDDRAQKAPDDIKLIQLSLDAGYQEYQKLLSQESQAAARHLKEKLRLMKMIYDSQQRQELLHKAILELQKKSILLSATKASANQSPESFSADIKSDNQWDDAQLGQLELELKALENNYEQLKDLIEKMSKKDQSSTMTVSQHIEGEKLQRSMDDLNHQGVLLRADLNNLRTQMIDLDKRKSHLELMIQQVHE